MAFGRRANNHTRDCVACGRRVRVGEGEYAKKLVSGEWTIKHRSGTCPDLDPSDPVDESYTDEPAPGVTRITLTEEPRMYRIDGHGEFPSATSVLDGGYGHGDDGPMDMWRTLEAAHEGERLAALKATDYKAWKVAVRAAPDRIALEAARFGTMVHNAIEAIIRARFAGQQIDIDALVEAIVPQDEHLRGVVKQRVAAHLAGWLRWEARWVVRWLGAELVLWDDEVGWAGSGDGLAEVYVGLLSEAGEWVPSKETAITVVDWKTSKFTDDKYRDAPGRITKDSYRLQVAGAYANARWGMSSRGVVRDVRAEFPPAQAIVAHVRDDGVTIECLGPDDIARYGAAYRIIAERYRAGLELTKLLVA